MSTYIVYKRSWLASCILYVVYAFIMMVLLAICLDYYPEIPDLISVFIVLGLVVFPYWLAQLSTKSRIRVILEEQNIVFHTLNDNLFVATLDTTLPYVKIKNIRMSSFPGAGNCLLVLMEDGSKLRLYKNRWVFTSNDNFYELFTAITRACERFYSAGYVNMPLQHNLTTDAAQPQEYMGTQHQPANQSPPPPFSIPDASSLMAGSGNGGTHTRPRMLTEEFRGNQFGSLAGIITWSGLFICPLVAAELTGLNGLITVLIFLAGLLWFYAFSTTLNYFEVTEDALIVRQHNLLWKRTEFRLADIKDLLMYKNMGGIRSISVIENDFSFRKYPAPTLSKQQWEMLKGALLMRNAKLRTEPDFLL